MRVAMLLRVLPLALAVLAFGAAAVLGALVPGSEVMVAALMGLATALGFPQLTHYLGAATTWVRKRAAKRAVIDTTAVERAELPMSPQDNADTHASEGPKEPPR